MSEYLGSAVLELRANAAPLRAGLMEAERLTSASVNRMQGSAARGMVASGAALNNVGRRMTGMVTVPILGVAAATAKMSMDFQAAMTLIQTQAGASAGEVAKLHDQVLALSGKVAQSPKALADGLYHLESIGLRGAKAMAALHAAADGAAVGHANLEQTATALGSAWLVQIKGAQGAMGSIQNLNSTMGILNATVGVGNMRMQDLVTSLGTGILPSAKRAGLALQDVMGALAVFSDEGYKAYAAATQMATAFHYITDPTAKATAALSTIGLKQFDLAAEMHKPQGLLRALTDLRQHLDATYPANSGRALTIDQETAALDKYRQGLEAGGVSGKKLADATEKYKIKLKEFGTAAVAQEAVLGDIFPAGRGRVLGVLMNQLGRYQQKLGQIGSGEKKWGADVAATHQTAAFKAKAAWDGLQADLVKFGDRVLPTFVKVGSDILHAVSGVFKDFEKLPKGMQDAILKGGLILAGIGPAMRVLGFFSTQIGRLTSLATVAGRLAMGQGFRQATSGTAGARLGLNNMVGTMEVNTLIAKSMIGGPGGIPGGPRPVGRNPVTGRFTPSPVPPAMGGPAAAAAAADEAALAERSMMSRIGGGLMRGLGVLGVAAFAAPLALGLGKAVSSWINHQAGAEGRDFANKFTQDLPNKVHSSIVSGLAKNFTKTQDDKLARTLDSYGGRGHPGGGVTPAMNKKVLDDYFNQGWLAGNATWKGLNSVKHLTAPILLNDFMIQLRKLPGEARPEAARVMLQYATGLAEKGKLPKNAIASMIQTLKSEFPGLQNFFKAQGYQSEVTIAKAMKFDRATNQLKQTLSDYRTQFGDLAIATKITGTNIDSNMQTAMIDLQTIIRTSTGKTRRDALAEYDLLKKGIVDRVTAMGSLVASKSGEMYHAVRDGSFLAYRDGSKNWGLFTQSVGRDVAAQQLSVGEGQQAIGKALNAILKQLGQAPLSLAQIGKLGPNIVAAVASGAVSSGAAASRFAQGGLVQVGQPGQVGPDSVPMNVGGQPIIVAPGEKVAVFNDGQQAVMDHALSHYGGLDGMFQAINQPHGTYSRGGRFATGGYVFPYNSGMRQGRTDMGTDWTGAGPIGAIGNARITRASPQNSGTGWPGAGDGGRGSRGALIAYQLLDGIDKGRYVYLAENIDPTVHQGQMVKAGQVIANARGAFPYTEQGWASGPTGSTAAAGHYTEGQVTAEGADFTRFVLGLAHGKLFGSTFGFSGGPTWTDIKAPKVKGGGTLGRIAQAALDKTVAAANKWGAAKVGAMGGGGSFSGTLSGPVPHQVYQFMSAAGFNKIAIAGMLGNAVQESSMNPNAPGGGLWQQISNFGGGTGGSLLHQMQTMLPQIQGIKGAMNAAGSPGAAAQIFEQSFERAGIPAMANRIAGANQAYAAGYARGGFVGGRRAFKTGGLSTTYPHIRSQPRLPKGRTGSGKSTTTKKKGTSIIKAAKSRRPPRFPTVKGIGNFDPEQNDLATEVSQVGDWQSFIGSLHGRDSVAPTVTTTDAQGNSVDHVNWGDPKASLAQTLMHPTGLIDDATGLPTLSIWDRIREIGTVANPMNPSNPQLTDTELGIEQTLLNLYLEEQGVAGGVLAQARANRPRDAKRGTWFDRALNPLIGWRQIGKMNFDDLGSFTTMDPQRHKWGWNKRHWKWSLLRPVKHYYTKRIWDKVKEYKNYQARIERLTKQREEIPLTRARREHAIDTRMRRARYLIRTGRIASGSALYKHLVDGELGLSKEERDLKAGLTHMPASWKGDSGAWSDQRKLEISSISDEFAARRAALQKATKDQKIAGSLSAAAADYAVATEGSSDKFALRQHFGTLENQIRDELRRDKLITGQDKKDITGYKKTSIGDLAAEDAAIAKLGPFLAPMGQLRIGILQKEHVDIPNLQREIATLLHTKLAGTGGSGGSGTSSQLASLLQQQLAQSGQALAVSQAQYGVLANLGDLAPFGGSFKDGGIVPGPTGAARIILAHGGEQITPADEVGKGPNVNVSFADGMSWLKNFMKVEIEQSNRSAVRGATGRLPGRGGGGLF